MGYYSQNVVLRLQSNPLGEQTQEQADAYLEEPGAYMQALLEVLQDLQRRGNAIVLVTSRMGLPGGLHGAHQQHLDPLEDGPALQLLQFWSGAGFADKLTQRQAAMLVQYCSGNARMLTILGGLVNCSPPHDSEVQRGHDRHHNSVITVLLHDVALVSDITSSTCMQTTIPSQVVSNWSQHQSVSPSVTAARRPDAGPCQWDKVRW